MASDAVTFKSLKLVGAITHEAGTGDGIAVVGHDQLEIDNGAHGSVPLFSVDLFQPREALIHIVEEGLGIVDEHPGRVQPTALDLVMTL